MTRSKPMRRTRRRPTEDGLTSSITRTMIRVKSEIDVMIRPAKKPNPAALQRLFDAIAQLLGMAR